MKKKIVVEVIWHDFWQEYGGHEYRQMNGYDNVSGPPILDSTRATGFMIRESV